MMQRLQGGVIGLGVGEQHILAYNEHPSFDVTTICDFNPKKLAEVSSRYPSLATTHNAYDVLRNPKINVVSIASYDSDHAQQILEAIEKDKHVFVEKPLCLFLEEAKKIVAAHKQKPRLKISSNLILRCSPRFLDLRARIHSGELGEIYSIEADYNYGRIEKLTKGWRGEADYYSVFLGGGVHMVDLVRWLTGAEVEYVYVLANRIATSGSNFKFPDFVSTLMQLDNGVCAKINANFGCVHPHFHALNVYGTNATFINDFPDARLIKSRSAEKCSEQIKTNYPGVAKGALLKKFLNEIIGEELMDYTTKDVLRTMAVCFAVEEAIKTNEKVFVKPIEKQLI
ncbi:MAG: dehydrogenase [Rhodopirellula sp.]|nr:dehydrogenase [Rhodopirellula sp.]